MNKTIINKIGQKDLKNIIDWKGNRSLADKIMSNTQVLDQNSAQKWLKKNEEDKNQVIKGIFHLNHDQNIFVGIVRLMFIDFYSKTAELGIFIGEDDLRGKGIGGEALRLILNYAFLKLELNKVYLRVTETNSKAINLYKKYNFKVEGRLKEHYYNLSSNKYENIIYMGLFRQSHSI